MFSFTYFFLSCAWLCLSFFLRMIIKVFKLGWKYIYSEASCLKQLKYNSLLQPDGRTEKPYAMTVCYVLRCE